MNDELTPEEQEKDRKMRELFADGLLNDILAASGKKRVVDITLFDMMQECDTRALEGETAARLSQQLGRPVCLRLPRGQAEAEAFARAATGEVRHFYRLSAEAQAHLREHCPGQWMNPNRLYREFREWELAQQTRMYVWMCGGGRSNGYVEAARNLGLSVDRIRRNFNSDAQKPFLPVWLLREFKNINHRFRVPDS